MKKILYILLTLSFLDVLSFSFILPALPFVVKSFSGGAFEVGITVSSAAVGMFFGGMFFGRMSDRYGRKNMILASIFLNTVGYLLFSFSPNLQIFLISRFICGLGGGGISVVQAYIGDISDDKNRAKNMGLVGASVGLGFALGPILGSFVADLGLKSMGLASALITIFALIGASPYLSPQQAKHHDDINVLKAPKNLIALFMSFFIITSAFAGVQTIFALFMNDRFAFGPKEVAYAFGYLGAIAIIFQGFFIGKLSLKFGEKNIFLIGMFLTAVSFIVIGKLQNIYFIYPMLSLLAIGFSSVNSSIYSLLSKLSHKNEFGKNMGINTAFGSMADMIGPFISGILYAEKMSMPFYFYGFLLIINLILAYFLVSSE